jgi:hypothetical protein
MSHAITDNLLDASNKWESTEQIIQGWEKRIHESWISNMEVRKDVQWSDPATQAWDGGAVPRDVDASGGHGALTAELHQSGANRENRICLGQLEMERIAMNVAREAKKSTESSCAGGSHGTQPEQGLKHTFDLERLYQFIHSSADAAPGTPSGTNE